MSTPRKCSCGHTEKSHRTQPADSCEYCTCTSFVNRATISSISRTSARERERASVNSIHLLVSRLERYLLADDPEAIKLIEEINSRLSSLEKSLTPKEAISARSCQGLVFPTATRFTDDSERPAFLQAS